MRAYRGDLIAFAAHHDGEIGELTAAPIRDYLSEIAGLSAASRKRKRAAVASFCRWAVRHELLDANPMDKIDTIRKFWSARPRSDEKIHLTGRGTAVSVHVATS